MPSEMEKKSGQITYEAGGTVAPRPPTPKAIKAASRAKVEIVRTYLGGGIVIMLTLAYVGALLLKVDAAGLLPIIGTGLGFLLGGQIRGEKDDS